MLLLTTTPVPHTHTYTHTCLQQCKPGAQTMTKDHYLKTQGMLFIVSRSRYLPIKNVFNARLYGLKFLQTLNFRHAFGLNFISPLGQLSIRLVCALEVIYIPAPFLVNAILSLFKAFGYFVSLLCILSFLMIHTITTIRSPF